MTDVKRACILKQIYTRDQLRFLTKGIKTKKLLFEDQTAQIKAIYHFQVLKEILV
jgi:hypothetical protein